MEVFLGDLADRLTARGHRVRVVTTTPAAPADQGARVPALIHAGAETEAAEVLRVPCWRLPAVGVPFSPRLPLRLRDALAADLPDVVHVHASVGSAGALAGGWAAHSLGLPLVVTVHSRLGRHAWVHRLAHGLTGWGGWADVLTGPGPEAARDVSRVVERPVSVLPNGVDVAWWREDAQEAPAGAGVRAGAQTGALRLVAVQRLKARKRGAELLDVLAAAHRRLPPGRSLALTVVGDGPRRTDLEARAGRLGLDVRFVGAVDRAGVRRALHAAEAFVLACPDEAFGIAAAEARAAGLPVVAYATGGLPALVPDGRAGILVESDAAMVRALVRLVREPTLLARLTAESRSLPPPFDWADVVGDHEEVYARAMTLRRAGG